MKVEIEDHHIILFSRRLDQVREQAELEKFKAWFDVWKVEFPPIIRLLTEQKLVDKQVFLTYSTQG